MDGKPLDGRRVAVAFTRARKPRGTRLLAAVSARKRCATSLIAADIFMGEADDNQYYRVILCSA